MAAHLNTDALTATATEKLLALDRTFIGTDDYMGMAYFWSYTYRHSMRPASYAVCRRVHRAFRAAGLPVSGESPAHARIVTRIAEGGKDVKVIRLTGVMHDA